MKNLNLLYLLALIFIISSCKKDEAPEVITSAIGEITYTSALAGGKIINTGTEPIIQYGVCWIEGTQIPTINDDKKIKKQENETEFTALLENLNPGTNYRLRAYATNSIGTSYGNLVVFATPGLGTPLVNTHKPSEITISSAIGKGEILDDNGSPILAYGLCWKKNDTNPTIDDNKIEIEEHHLGQFTLLIDNLEASSIYYIKAYAINDLGVSYGQQIMFYTDSAIKPELITNSVSQISHDSALGGGTIIDPGTYPITAYGLVWCLAPSLPDITDYQIELTGMVNQFDIWLTDLEINSQYRVRAYVKNQLGITYGQVIDFRTNFQTITDIDGNEYRFTQIGDQVWMIDNYKAVHFRDGTPIPNQTENTFWHPEFNPPAEPGYCWYNNDYQTYGTVYGALYNWHAANHPLLPPEGWRLPTYEELGDLIDYLGGFFAGGEMKTTGFTYWDPPNTGATNSSNFSAIGSGGRGENFGSLNKRAFFWSSSHYPGMGAHVLTMYHDRTLVSWNGIYNIISGFSVRFIKD
jgi:uncharacterized protein (TIGR02145 family)